MASETIYTPESSLRHPLRLARAMASDLVASRELAWRLMVRDISAQYRQTALGYFWAVFPPLVTSAVFVLLRGSRITQSMDGGVPYAAWVFAGTIFWQLFVDAMTFPLRIATEAKAVITKIALPKEALVLSSVAQVLFAFLIKILLLAAALLVFKAPLAWTALLAPVPLLGLLLLGTTIGVLLIPLGLLFKDVTSALTVLTSGLVFVTPVAYPSTLGGTLGRLMRLNPLSPLLEGARDLLFTGVPAQWQQGLVVMAWSLTLLLLAWLIYRLALPLIIERVGA